jgi:hypothetical protein
MPFHNKSKKHGALDVHALKAKMNRAISKGDLNLASDLERQILEAQQQRQDNLKIKK